MRVDTRPRGFQIIMNTIAAPNSSMRYWVDRSPGRRSASSSRVRASVRARRSSPQAAMATPSCEPIPPSTTIARMVADSMKVKLSGLTTPGAPRRRVGEPGEHRPERKAVSLVLVVLMPSERQAISSSRRPPRRGRSAAGAAQRDEVGEQRERQDEIEQEHRTIDRRGGQMKDRGENVIFVIGRNAEEADIRNAGNAGVAVGEIHPVDQHEADDFAEGQRHDREIVAAKPQNRKAEDHAPHRGEDAASGRQTQNDRRKEVESSA